MQKKKFVKPTQHLRVGVGLVFVGDAPKITNRSKGVSEVRLGRGNITKVYLDLDSGNIAPEEGHVDRVEIPVHEKLQGAPYGELLLNNNRPGARVLFGRNGEGEDDSFGFDENQRYISLRFYAQERLPEDNPNWEFDPLYVRIDKGQTKTFLCLTVRWENDVVVVEIDRNPSEYDIPVILT